MMMDHLGPEIFSTRRNVVRPEMLDFVLRYHGRWIFPKNAKNLFLDVQIEKTEINILQKEWGKGLFYFLS